MAVVDKLHPLGVLIDQVKAADARWDTDELLARRATERGWPASKQTISALRTKPLESISVKRVRMLMAALNLSAQPILEAAIRSMDFDWSAELQDGVEAAIRADGRLSSDDKRYLRALVKEMRRGHALVTGETDTIVYPAERDNNSPHSQPPAAGHVARGSEYALGERNEAQDNGL